VEAGGEEGRIGAGVVCSGGVVRPEGFGFVGLGRCVFEWWWRS
jgi:hypothetical protein